MFEREFEFSVQQSIRVCEERVLSMERRGLLGFLSIDAQTTAIDDKLRKIQVTQRTGGLTTIDMEVTINEVKNDTSSVSGIAELSTVGFQGESVWLLMCLMLATILTFQSPYVQDARLFIQIDGLLILTFVWLMAWRMFIRNRLIDTLQKKLNQPKKKQA